MTLLTPLLWTVLVGCEPAPSDACVSGVRETFSGTVTTPTGSVSVETSQCVRSLWTTTACDEGAGPEACTFVFEPKTPAKAPLELIYGDFVGTNGVGHLELSPPPVIAGTADIQAGLNTVKEARSQEGYRTSTVQPITMLDGNPAYALTVSCDHPDTDPICPFTWDYLFVDLDAVEPGLYADFSAYYAADVDAGNAASAFPEEFGDWQEMVDSATVTVQ